MMFDSKHLGFFFFLIFCLSKTCCSIVFCPETEKHALLNFKQSLEDPSHMLSSWNNESEGNCCAWKGVVCSNITGHVRQLHLRGQQFSLSGEMNPSILLLKELKYLDLSYNNFGVRIPSFLGLLTSLEYLDLSYSGFRGRIPHNIGNLSNLHTLNLDDEYYHDVRLDVDSMDWVSGMSGLEYLSMNGVDLSKAANWIEVINRLPSLVNLHLRYCSLKSMSPLKHVNFSSLTLLDLSGNNFSSITMPRWIFQQPNLISLDLSGSYFGGPLPAISNTTKLKFIDLSGNNFSSIIMPRWIFQLPSLVELHLSSCFLNLPSSDVNISSLTLLDLSSNYIRSIPWPSWIFQQPNLISLDLSYNSFEGPLPAISNTTKLKFIDLSNNIMNSSIPDWLYFCKDLEYVSMSGSNLHGKISNAIGNLTSLTTLDLSYNELSGNIPTGIASLCEMQNLDLSENKLIGDVSYSFGNISVCFLEVVTSLILSNNQLSGQLTPQFGEFKSLQTLYLGMNSISGTIPINIGKLSSLIVLDLSYNKLTGNLPESLGQLLKLEYLIIAHNMLEGIVTETHFSNLTNLKYLRADNHLSLKVSSAWVPPFTLYELHLGSWNFGGDRIPSWIETHESITDLDLSNTGISRHIPTRFLEIPVLNLSNNNLYGQIPYIISNSVVSLSGNKFSGSLPRIANNVSVLDLSNNSFTAGISQFLCDTTSRGFDIQILHLWGNQLTGELPDCFMKWQSLVYLNLANNNFSGNIPNSIGFLAHLLSLNLHGNKFSGQIPFPIHNCTRLLKLNLGGNDLAGNIPAWIGSSFAELMFLILRSNKLSGEIPPDVCRLNALQILDLSDNAFLGMIPKCVDNLTAMATQRSLDTYRRKEVDTPFDFYEYKESASVATKGRVYVYDTILSLVTNMDLSNNNLSGDIPEELTTLVQLRSLNLSGNDLTGRIPDRMGDMKQLESLDLSRNSLFGEIPNNFTLMSSLSYLDLSFNNLTGRIPTSTQLQLMNASSFVGNHLCGPPLSNNCSDGDGDGDESVNDDPSDNDEAKIEWVYVFLSLGYAVGLSACCTALALKKSWRDAWFGLLKCIWNKLYVHFCVKWRSLTMKPPPLS